MWVKVCGNTRLEDALQAAELGADAVGFIFAAGSRREVSADAVRGISDVLGDRYPEVERVGVFTSGDAGWIARVRAHAGLTAIQLHGEEAQGAAPALRRQFPLSALYAAAPWSGPGDLALRATLCAPVSFLYDALLVDAPGAARQGGTGRAFPWEAAREAFREVKGDGVRLVAAGGLDAGNVSAAMHTLQPWGVDVASGTESEPGIKDAGKVRAFLAAVRQA